MADRGNRAFIAVKFRQIKMSMGVDKHFII